MKEKTDSPPASASIFCAVLFLASILASCSSGERKDEVTNAVSEQGLTRPFSGDSWLSLDKSGRRAFVEGFLVGAADGQSFGCTTVTNAVEASPPGAKLGHEFLEQTRRDCEPENLHRFTKPPEFYEDVLTRFYSEYREDRDIPYPSLLPELADSTDVEKTPAGIHKHIQRAH